jgi:flagellar protein FliO/FliZ
MKMDFHRNSRRDLIAPLAAALVMLLMAGGALAAQDAAPAPTPQTPEASMPVTSTGATPSNAEAEDRPISIHRDGVEGSPIGKGGNGGNAWALGRTLGALAIVVGLIFLASWLLRRVGGRQTRGDQDVMQILARKSISARQQLLLVRLGQRLVLVGSSSGALSMLSEITDQAEVESMLESVQAGQGGFAGLLKGKIAKRGTPVGAVSSSVSSGRVQGEETHGRDAHATGGAKP